MDQSRKKSLAALVLDIIKLQRSADKCKIECRNWSICPNDTKDLLLNMIYLNLVESNNKTILQLLNVLDKS